MSQAIQFPRAYPKHKKEPTLTVYRFTIAKRTVDHVLDCLEQIKLPGVTITEGTGTWFNDYGELLIEKNVTIETSAFTFDKVRKLIQALLHFPGEDVEDSTYITFDGEGPGLITNEDKWKAIESEEK